MCSLVEFRNNLYDFPNRPVKKKIKSVEYFMEVVKDFFFDEFEKLGDKELNGIRDVIRCPGKSKKDIIKERLKADIGRGIEAVEVWHKNHVEGLRKFYELFFSDKKKLSNLLRIEVVSKDTPLYRMREGKNYELFTREEIFSLPDNLTHLAGKARFNLDGFPCLYLASNLYLAWEELRRPDIDHVNFALFKPVKEVKVICLYIPWVFNAYCDFLSAYYALVCSAKAKDDDKFKCQYTVPNLFMMSLFSAMENGYTVCGIKYLSSRRFESKQFKFNAIDIDTAYVFPDRDVKDGVGKRTLRDSFVLSEPRTCFLYNLHGFDFNTKKARIDNYDTSMFAEIERQLGRETLEKCKEATQRT